MTGKETGCPVTERDRARFAALCEEENNAAPVTGGGGIGTYGEKRLHRILKRFACPRTARHEVPVGRYVADVVAGKKIIEIQTGSFYPLRQKLTYYLTETDYTVLLVHPLLAENTLYRVERETGELLRKRRSNRRESAKELLPELYWLREHLSSERLVVFGLLIRAEEYRYSERVRYRRAGAYESELFPKELLGAVILGGTEDYRGFLPEERSFTAAEYQKRMGYTARSADRALKTLCFLGLLTREKEGKKYIYRRTDTRE